MQNCRICCLYSGSKGNATFISAGGASILIDAGKSAKALCAALDRIGVSISDIDAIFITHEHNDHVSALRTLSHKHTIPMHMLLRSARKAFDGLHDERLCNCLRLYDGDHFETSVKGLRIKAFPTPHDSIAAVGYRLSYLGQGGEEISLAVSTDTGCVTTAMRENLTGCSAVVIESNHDPFMLAAGPYPYELKERIRSSHGHLSNPDCAALAKELCNSGTRHIMLAHLSEENNDPHLAYEVTRSVLREEAVNLRVASPTEPVWLLGDLAE